MSRSEAEVARSVYQRAFKPGGFGPPLFQLGRPGRVSQMGAGACLLIEGSV